MNSTGFGMSKAQVSPITIVIIAGMGIMLAAAAFAWALPIIEKRTTINDYTIAENFIKNLDDKIISVANSMSGEESLEIPLGLVTVTSFDPEDPENSNTINLEFITPQPLVVDGSVYVDTDKTGSVAEYGEAEPRIILLSGDWQATRRNILDFDLHYRELDTMTAQIGVQKGYIIALNGITGSGSNRITIEFDYNTLPNPKVIPGGAENNGDLIITYVNIILE